MPVALAVPTTQAPEHHLHDSAGGSSSQQHNQGHSPATFVAALPQLKGALVLQETTLMQHTTTAYFSQQACAPDKGPCVCALL